MDTIENDLKKYLESNNGTRYLGSPGDKHRNLYQYLWIGSWSDSYNICHISENKFQSDSSL